MTSNAEINKANDDGKIIDVHKIPPNNFDIQLLNKIIGDYLKHKFIKEKKNEKIKEKVGKPNKNENNIKEIEIENISSQIFCEDFHNNLYQYLKRKKESLKISNLFNNNNSKNNYNTNNNKYKIEQSNSYDSKKNTVYIPAESSKTNVKTLGKKRKSK